MLSLELIAVFGLLFAMLVYFMVATYRGLKAAQSVEKRPEASKATEPAEQKVRIER
jgi:hypothetical protein